MVPVKSAKTEEGTMCNVFLQSALSWSSSEMQSFSQNSQSEVELQEYKAVVECPLDIFIWNIMQTSKQK